MICVKCGVDHSSKWYSPKTNPICGTCYRRDYVVKNKEKVTEYYKQYNAKAESVQRRKNYESSETGKSVRKNIEHRYYKNNPDKMSKKRDTDEQRERLKDHYRRNKPYYNEKSARRSRDLDKASLKNAYKEETLLVYETCPVGFEVDHIVPVKGKNVSGLHVPWNLQHLPKLENRRKSNKY